MVVNTRSADDIAAGHVPGPLTIPPTRAFTTWAGWLVPYERDFYLVMPVVDEDWVARRIGRPDVVVLDIRRAAERETGRVPGALHIPLGYLGERLDEPPPERTVVVHCESGGRSAIAAGVLRGHGVDRVVDFLGGIRAWREAGHRVESGPDRTPAPEAVAA